MWMSQGKVTPAMQNLQPMEQIACRACSYAARYRHLPDLCKAPWRWTSALTPFRFFTNHAHALTAGRAAIGFCLVPELCEVQWG